MAGQNFHVKPPSKAPLKHKGVVGILIGALIDTLAGA